VEKPIVALGLGTGAATSPLHPDRLEESIAAVGLTVDHISIVDRHTIDTPFGSPDADPTRVACKEGLFFIVPRHGAGHTMPPSGIPWKRNVATLRALGVTHTLEATAVGSLVEESAPGSLVILDQSVDLGGFGESWFLDGPAAHISPADPTCADLDTLLASVAMQRDIPVQQHGTCVTIRGPEYSTRAESEIYRLLRCTHVGMTMGRLVKLLRGARIHSAFVALVCDYDCWRHDEATVTAEMVEAALPAMQQRVAMLFLHTIRAIFTEAARECTTCTPDLLAASHTPYTHMTSEQRALLDFLSH
jgi:5'-methylthioadenosine phosphorylase